MAIRTPRTEWDAYLDRFHATRPGVAEEVLARARNGNHRPHRWLARAVAARATSVLDIACGSGAMSRELQRPGRTVIGLDVSAAELDLAAQRGPGPWILGDALRLPLADASVDAVVSSMGIAVIDPASDLLAEAARVVKPGGVVAFMAPALRPLTAADIALRMRIGANLKTVPQYPTPLEMTDFAATFRRLGLRKIEDGRERYVLTVRSRADAELILSSLYLPSTSDARFQAAIGFLERQVLSHGEVAMAIPMRRVVALK